MESPEVLIKQGRLKGCVRTDIDGNKFFSFLGIPYAKPPIGELRFKAPLPAEPWDGIRDATKEGDICYSRDEFIKEMQGSEDCLTLNVFTKDLPGSNHELKPVMVWIHGGGFTAGSSKTSTYGPEFLITEDIVLVSINYRLGILGFLSIEDTSLNVPGNAGLKDQSLALTWVQENIKSFNGDPNNVTIFGESAGSASVHYHILSKSSKGLFHKAILQSGSAFNSWALGRHMAIETAKYFKQDVKNEKEALDILRNIPIEQLYPIQEIFFDQIKPRELRPFGPVIEKPNETAFITKSPLDIITSGEYNKVPLIFGYNTREGMLMDVYKVIKLGLQKTPEKTQPPNIEHAIPWQVNFKSGSPAIQKICLKIKNTYFKGPDLEDDVRVLSSDSIFIAGIIAAVKNHVETSSQLIYLYRMSLDAGLNFLKKAFKLNLPGVCHADDLGYLFKSHITPELKPGSLEEVSVRRFVKLWTNFAKYGNPTPNKNGLGITWEPVEKQKMHFLDIDEQLTVGVNPEPERFALWKEIYQLDPNTEKFL